MQNAITETTVNATAVIEAAPVVAQAAVAVAAPVAAADAVDAVVDMRKRVEALAIEREVWETGALARSNDMLYALIQKCYALYLDLTATGSDTAAKKLGFKDYLNNKGYTFTASTPLTGKIIRCVFGDRDRRRRSTYHTVLRAAVNEKWAVNEVSTKIAERGGVQEISLVKPGYLKPSEKANQARDLVLSTSLATVASDKLAAQSNIEKKGEQAVAVVTQNDDGSYTIHCIVHGEGLLNAALASYFGANKEAIKQQQAQQVTVQAAATQEQLIVNAGAAAANAGSQAIAA